MTVIPSTVMIHVPVDSAGPNVQKSPGPSATTCASSSSQLSYGNASNIA